MVSNKKLIIHELKRNTWVIAILFLTMLFLKPVLAIMEFENQSRLSVSIRLIEYMERYLLQSYPADIAITYVSALLLGLVGFAFVFSKSKVDLYHSIPVKRTRRFGINYLSGLIIFIVLYTLITGITAVIAATSHYLTTEAVKTITITYTATIVHFIYSYSLVVLAVMLTGNIVVCFAAIGVLSLGYIMFTEMICAYMRHFFITKTSYFEIGAPLWRKFPYLSPVTSNEIFMEKSLGFYNATPFTGRTQAFVFLIKVLFFALIVLVSAYYLYTLRSSEAAGKSVAFKISQPFVRIPVVILTGLFAGYIMQRIASAYQSKWLWIGAVIGVILAHFVMEMIFSQNFKAFYKNKIQLAACLAVTVFIILIFDKDLFKYDYYIPERADIKSAAVVFYDVDTDLNFSEFARTEEGTWQGEYKGKDAWVMDRMFEDDGMIDLIYDISNLGAASVDDMKNERIKQYYGTNYVNERSYKIVQQYENAIAEEVSVVGGADGPTSVFVAGKITDDETEGAGTDDEDGGMAARNAGLPVSSDPDYSDRLALAKQYLEDSGIVISELPESDYRTTVLVAYKLKNNTTTLRRYTIPVESIEKTFNDIYKSETFKKAHFNIYDIVEKQDAVYKVEAYDTLHTKQISLLGNDAKEFMDIYLEELLTLSADDLKQIPIGQITPLVKGEFYDETLSGYYIYPGFSKTIAYMEDKGVNMEFFTTDVDVSKIQQMSAMYYNMFFLETDENGETVRHGINTDTAIYASENPEDMAVIEMLAPYMEIMSYAYSNHLFVRFDDRYDVTVVLEPEHGMQRFFDCKVRVGNTPQEFIDDLTIKLYEYRTENEDAGDVLY